MPTRSLFPYTCSRNHLDSSGAMRKNHSKSRFGCKECKRRRIKCDEARPSCAKCSKHGRPCSYLDTTGVLNMLPSPSSFSVQCASPIPNSKPSAASDSSRSHSIPASLENPENELLVERYSLFHLELFQHFKERLGGTVQPNHPEVKVLELAVREAITKPYLMDELLAFSAAHKSTMAGEHQHFYAAEAVRLQTRALSRFIIHNAEVSDENCVTIFIFSILLGQHTLFDSFSSLEDLDAVLDRFIQCLNLNRGVRITAGLAWPKMTEQLQAQGYSELVDTVGPATGAPGSECDTLLRMLDRCELSHSAVEACRDAVKFLQFLFDSSRSESSSDNRRLSHVQGWPVRIPDMYVCLLSQRRPEPLVILAYYAVLLHRSRGHWVVGSSGRYLIQAIRDRLGPDWAHWLEWPVNMLECSSIS